MNTQRVLTYAAVAGGLAWLCKLTAASIDMDSPVVAFFFVLGLTLLPIGSIGLALRFLEHRPRWLRLAGVALAPFAFLAIFSFLDSTLVPLTEDHVREWAKAEAGVGTAAVLWLATGVWALRRAPAGRREVAR
jgi:hypothetical protein